MGEREGRNKINERALQTIVNIRFVKLVLWAQIHEVLRDVICYQQNTPCYELVYRSDAVFKGLKCSCTSSSIRDSSETRRSNFQVKQLKYESKMKLLAIFVTVLLAAVVSTEELTRGEFISLSIELNWIIYLYICTHMLIYLSFSYFTRTNLRIAIIRWRWKNNLYGIYAEVFP